MFALAHSALAAKNALLHRKHKIVEQIRVSVSLVNCIYFYFSVVALVYESILIACWTGVNSS